MSGLRPLLAAFAVVVALASCTSKDSDQPQGDLPAGDELLRTSAQQMREVKTAKFVITAEGSISGLALRRAEGVLTREGNAKGTARVDQFGGTAELEFVIVGGKLYVKGPTGGFQELPLALASTVYDPSAILDPERGVAKILSTASEPRTEARESVDGQQAYRVRAKVDGPALSTIVPGAAAGTTATLWIGDDPRYLRKATFQLPGSGSSAGGTVTATFTEFDAPVTINAP